MKIFFHIALLVLITHISSLAQEKQDTTKQLFELSATKNLLGTVIEAKMLYDSVEKGKKILYLAFKEIARIDEEYSLQRENSRLNYVNRFASKAPVKISEEFFSLLERAIQYSKKYDGLFDVTVGPLTQLWGFSSDSGIHVQTEKSLKPYLHLVDYRKIVLNKRDTTVFFPEEGMMLDFGGIAKGYAVDRACEIMKKYGVKNFIIDAGGDLYAAGKNIENEDWSIGIKHPRKLTELIAKFRLTDMGAATSGDYERFIDVKGKRYHHILYPATGMPGALCQSTTVLFDNVEEGTILSKYVFLLGIDKFLKTELSKKLKYFIITSKGKIYYSPGMEIENQLEIFNEK